MTSKKGSRRRLWPSLWYRLILVLPLGLMLAVRMVDMGDRGMNNVFTMMLMMVFLLLSVPWLIFASGYSLKVRLGVPLAGLLFVVGFFMLFDFDGVSGSMIPRFTSSAQAALPGVAGTSAPDLTLTTAHDFPGFLGADRSGQVGHVRLARDWKATPPVEIWRQRVGAGWSGFAVVNGVAVTMEQRSQDETVTAYEASSGRLLWVHRISGPFSHPLGGVGPRSTPAIDQGRVYALGTRGALVALDGEDGDLIWKRDLLKDFDLTPEQEQTNIAYGRSNSPLILGNLVVIPAGGTPGGRMASLAAYDKVTGEPVWEGGDDQISFASPSFAHLAGQDQVLIVNESTVSGHDPASGRTLWSHPRPGRTSADANVSQAVPLPPDRVLISKGYGLGGEVLALSPGADGQLQVDEVWANTRVLRTKFTQALVRDGYSYGLSDGILECVDLATGKRVWKAGRYGHGQILGAGDLLLVLSEDGEVILIEPTPDTPDKVLGRFQALDGRTWNNFALYGDLLVVRNHQEATAWRVPLA